MTLRRIIYNSFDYSHAENKERFESCGIPAGRKPEKVTLEEIVELANAYDVTMGEMAEIIWDDYIDDYGKY